MEIEREMKKKSKLRLYNVIKEDRDVEKYVKLNMLPSERSLLPQLRMGILPLRIETGRFIKLKPEERICQLCNSKKVEDELHFLFDCKAYDKERKIFVSEMCKIVANFKTMSYSNRLKLCCAQEPRKLAKYICKVFEKRKELQYKS